MVLGTASGFAEKSQNRANKLLETGILEHNQGLADVRTACDWVRGPDAAGKENRKIVQTNYWNGESSNMISGLERGRRRILASISRIPAIRVAKNFEIRANKLMETGVIECSQ
jgi:hypothetical protein